MAGYEVSPEAEDDLFDIWRKVAEDAGVGTADRVESEIRGMFDKLAALPHQGHWRHDLSARLRFWPVWSYLIAYRPEPSPILIIGVLHGRRHPDTLAGILTGRQKRP
jgi:antitoxin ParD1/3/4/toxin ParE1/3/4